MSSIEKYVNLASGDVLSFTLEGEDHYINANTDIDAIQECINFNYALPSFRIYVLFPDETINYEIPNSVIKSGGSYSENYQDGQRRSLSFTIYNEDGEYSPSINKLWAGTRLRLDVGITYNSVTAWFHKGIFVINKVTPSLSPTSREVAISAGDKFNLFENTTGRLETSYNIEADTDIEDVITTIQKASLGDGTVFDSKPLIYHSSFKGKRTQAAISKSAGDNYGSILTELATQLSAEIFYNSEGNLTLIPIKDATQDEDKPIVYHFAADDGDFSQLSFDYDYNSIVNRVVVIGSSDSGSVNEATAINSDERSPFCYQRIGYRTGNIINDSNITTDTLARERAEYELRQQLILKTSSSTEVLFNPFLSVNNLIAVNSDFFNLDRNKYLIQSLSFSLDYSNKMNVSFTNIINVKTDIGDIKIITPTENPNYSYIIPSATRTIYPRIDSWGKQSRGIVMFYLGDAADSTPGQSSTLQYPQAQGILSRSVANGTKFYLHAQINSRYYKVYGYDEDDKSHGEIKKTWVKHGDGLYLLQSLPTDQYYYADGKGNGMVLMSMYDSSDSFTMSPHPTSLEAVYLPSYRIGFIFDLNKQNLKYLYVKGETGRQIATSAVEGQTLDSSNSFEVISSNSITVAGEPKDFYEFKSTDVVTVESNVEDGDQIVKWPYIATRLTGTIQIAVNWDTFSKVTVEYYGVTDGQKDATTTSKEFSSGTISISGVARGTSYWVSGTAKNVSYISFPKEEASIDGETSTFAPEDSAWYVGNQLTAKNAETCILKVYTGVGTANCTVTYYPGYQDKHSISTRGTETKISTSVINSSSNDGYNSTWGYYKAFTCVKSTEVTYSFTAESGYTVDTTEQTTTMQSDKDIMCSSNGKHYYTGLTDSFSVKNDHNYAMIFHPQQSDITGSKDILTMSDDKTVWFTGKISFLEQQSIALDDIDLGGLDQNAEGSEKSSGSATGVSIMKYYKLRFYSTKVKQASDKYIYTLTVTNKNAGTYGDYGIYRTITTASETSYGYPETTITISGDLYTTLNKYEKR